MTVLDEPPVKWNGRVIDISGGGFQILSEGRIPLNSAVRVDLADAVLLGEVCYCREQAGGLYAVGLESQQILSHTSDFAQLMRSLAGYSDQASEVPERQES